VREIAGDPEKVRVVNHPRTQARELHCAGMVILMILDGENQKLLFERTQVQPRRSRSKTGRIKQRHGQENGTSQGQGALRLRPTIPVRPNETRN
jgi:hypothetical protein